MAIEKHLLKAHIKFEVNRLNRTCDFLSTRPKKEVPYSILNCDSIRPHSNPYNFVNTSNFKISFWEHIFYTWRKWKKYKNAFIVLNTPLNIINGLYLRSSFLKLKCLIFLEMLDDCFVFTSRKASVAIFGNESHDCQFIKRFQCLILGLNISIWWYFLNFQKTNFAGLLYVAKVQKYFTVLRICFFNRWGWRTKFVIKNTKLFECCFWWNKITCHSIDLTFVAGTQPHPFVFNFLESAFHYSFLKFILIRISDTGGITKAKQKIKSPRNENQHTFWILFYAVLKD